MSGRDDRNRAIIEEFRANEGVVEGPFRGIPLLLLHHVGAKSGTERINPLAYQRVGADAVAVFASKGGSPTNPDWYYNLKAHPSVSVEIGTMSYPATARVATGEERDRIWSRQKADFPSFAAYEARAGRRIPVIVLDRA